jgi:hypothetical protein
MQIRRRASSGALVFGENQTDVSRLKGDVHEFGRGFSMFEPLGNDSEGESLDTGHGFVTVGTVAHDAGQARHFGQPATVGFAFNLNRENHDWYSNIRTSLRQFRRTSDTAATR